MVKSRRIFGFYVTKKKKTKDRELREKEIKDNELLQSKRKLIEMILQIWYHIFQSLAL